MKFTLPLLSLCTIALALAVPPANVTRVVDTKAHMNGTKTGVDTEKRTLGNVFLCTAAFFSGFCVTFTGEFNGGCVDLAVDLDNQVSSFGPGQGQRCQLAHGCANSDEGIPAFSGFIAFPGIQNFSVSWIDADGRVNAPFNDIISSYRCNYNDWEKELADMVLVEGFCLYAFSGYKSSILSEFNTRYQVQLCY
ncbi:hypothetical protein DFH08DRAFT_963579 [Mycena albidolilacea]|uniref:Uncharacterized protein n=1 Tax=Mycena albidolilacea TaxID=1033008 RepID=A0AAD7EPI7_9AGAR|nr:hypothetical protein DFH08DRAFT_963579 [Mycena albidolilacea]